MKPLTTMITGNDKFCDKEEFLKSMDVQKEIVVLVDGRIIGKVVSPTGEITEEVLGEAREVANRKRDTTLLKTIIVPGKIINFVDPSPPRPVTIRWRTSS